MKYTILKLHIHVHATIDDTCNVETGEHNPIVRIYCHPGSQL